MAQLVSVLGLGPSGPPFESEYPDTKKSCTLIRIVCNFFLLWDLLEIGILFGPVLYCGNDAEGYNLVAHLAEVLV